MPWWNRQRRPGPAAQIREAVEEVGKQLDRVEAPQLPDIKLPEMKLPDLRLSDVRMPEVKVPDTDVRVETRKARRGPPIGAAAALVAGALLAYFLDPDRGRSRRAVTADRLAALGRRMARRFGRWERRSVSTMAGLGHRLGGSVEPIDVPNDETLAHKVESVLFRDPTIEKGRMNVNAENGVVILRGVADSPAQIERIMAATVAIEGVRAVRSLLRVPDHLPGDGTTDTLEPATQA